MVHRSEYLDMARKNKDRYFNIFVSPLWWTKSRRFGFLRCPRSWDLIQWHLPNGSCSRWDELSIVGFSDGTWRQRNSQLIETENSRWIPHCWQRATGISGATSWETEPCTSFHLGKMSNVLFGNIWTARAILPIGKNLQSIFFLVYFSLPIFLLAV